MPPAESTIARQQTVLRADIEEAAHLALASAKRLIAILDHIDGYDDIEQNGDGGLSSGAPRERGDLAWLGRTARAFEIDEMERTA